MGNPKVMKKRWGVDEYHFNFIARRIEILFLCEPKSNNTGYQRRIYSWARKID